MREEATISLERYNSFIDLSARATVLHKMVTDSLEETMQEITTHAEANGLFGDYADISEAKISVADLCTLFKWDDFNKAQKLWWAFVDSRKGERNG